MLIGICGGIFAGCHSVQDYLCQKHAFQPLRIEPTKDGLHGEQEGTFSNVDTLLEFVTKNWQKNYVTCSIHNESILDTLSHRPFFILVHVDAPLSIRWKRSLVKQSQPNGDGLPAGSKYNSLEEFVANHDNELYSPTANLATLSSRAQIKILNTTSSLTKLHAHLDALNLPDPHRLRPTWDQYFMTLASLAARRSNCMRRQVGCVLVREARVISTGYNGTPRHVTNCNEGGCPRCNGAAGGGGSALNTCLCIHAEENALLEAGRERIGGGAVLYCNTCPCLTCTIKIVQVGIAEVVFSRSYYMDAEAAKIFKEAGVKLRQFSPPKEGVVNVCDDGDDVSAEGGMAGLSLSTNEKHLGNGDTATTNGA